MSGEQYADVAQMIRAYLAKPGNEAGGNLHIVLDDLNVADRHLYFCEGYAAALNDTDGVRLATALLHVPADARADLIERASAL